MERLVQIVNFFSNAKINEVRFDSHLRTRLQLLISCYIS